MIRSDVRSDSLPSDPENQGSSVSSNVYEVFFELKLEKGYLNSVYGYLAEMITKLNEASYTCRREYRVKRKKCSALSKVTSLFKLALYGLKASFVGKMLVAGCVVMGVIAVAQRVAFAILCLVPKVFTFGLVEKFNKNVRRSMVGVCKAISVTIVALVGMIFDPAILISISCDEDDEEGSDDEGGMYDDKQPFLCK